MAVSDIRSEASYTRRYPDTALLARPAFGHMGDCRPRRRDLGSVLRFGVRASPLVDLIYSIHTHHGSTRVGNERATSGIY